MLAFRSDLERLRANDGCRGPHKDTAVYDLRTASDLYSRFTPHHYAPPDTPDGSPAANRRTTAAL